MLPGGSVVACPDRPDSLGACEEGPAEHKWPVSIWSVLCGAPKDEPVCSGFVVVQAIDIVNVAMLNVAIVQCILRHRNLRPGKD